MEIEMESEGRSLWGNMLLRRGPNEPEEYEHVLSCSDNSPWVMKIKCKNHKATIKFNREDYPDLTPDDFAKKVCDILEEVLFLRSEC